MKASDINFRKLLALKLHIRYKRNVIKLHSLNYILWECTLKCNLACKHCGSDCKKDSTVADMPVNDFIGAIDQIISIVEPNNTLVVFTGGEPLVRSDIEIAGKELYDRGFPWGIVTNGFLLTRQRLNSLMDAGMRSITVSLDGLETSHNWLRGNPKSFERAFSAIKMLTQIPDLKYDVVTCVTPKNFNELHHLRELLIDNGIQDWRIFTIFPIGRAKTNELLQLSSVDFKLLFDFISQTRNEGKIKLNYGCEGYLGKYEGEVRDNFFFCRAGINIASILADGSVSACPNLRDNFIQGNIYHDNLADIWTNRYEKFRDRSWVKTGKCAECESYQYCGGNGLHLRDEKSGELLFCHLERIEEGIKEQNCSLN
jgi:radical SAM enzyme (rSAM/lipoprotein system)